MWWTRTSVATTSSRDPPVNRDLLDRSGTSQLRIRRPEPSACIRDTSMVDKSIMWTVLRVHTFPLIQNHLQLVANPAGHSLPVQILMEIQLVGATNSRGSTGQSHTE